MTHKLIELIEQLERDIRNQVVIDSLKRLTRKQSIMIFIRRRRLTLTFAALALAWTAFWCVLIGIANADELKIPCPTPGEPCRIVFLSPQEERLLTGQNGILDTAAQGRQIDLGGFAVYFKSKIAAAPAGEMQKAPEAAKPDKPVDKPAE